MARQPYEARFHVSLIGRHGGFQSIPVLSAEEFVRVARELDPVFSADALAVWVAERLGDPELGEALREACLAEPAFHQAPAAHVLMAERLAEAEQALGLVPERTAGADAETTVAAEA
ncbi:MAG: hypothetical protein QMC79_07715 [Anaerosomatales bacterium]|nr:hypothetical protein [Anaerosomatales bacterium]